MSELGREVGHRGGGRLGTLAQFQVAVMRKCATIRSRRSANAA